MSVGRIELINGQKQFKRYDSGGGGISDTKSEYVYVEKFVKTEALLNAWNLNEYGRLTLRAKMYDAISGEYLGENYNGKDSYTVKYVPQSFSMIPYSNPGWPTSVHTVGVGFFACLGIAVEIDQGIFKFTNTKKISKNPLFTLYELYGGGSDNASENELKDFYPAMLFRGFLKKLEANDPMYLKIGTKTLNDAESNI